ncbi:uncharacterized protein [Palaemon carinicauda]|uniref:uncharacterized protein isoform X2 n=1 Tax=Palaemon carinicauda TaxID=392227 RepID=UPI0035B63E32
MNFYAIIATAVLFGLSSGNKVGNKCTYKSQCTKDSYGIDETECIDGFCQCKDPELIKYNSKLEPSCGGIFSLSYVKVLERCHVTSEGEALSCNYNEHSLCGSGRCICFESFYPNTTSGKCEPMAEYMKLNNLTEYRARPEEYCREDSQCISGLKCQDYKCRCPTPCSYKKEEEICDCGPIEWPSAVAPIIFGIILGLGIMGFWVFMIKRTIKKHVEKKESAFVNLQEIRMSPEGTDSIAFSPAPPSDTASPAPPVGLSFPASAEGQAPVSNDALPYKPGADASNGLPPPPPQASLYGINDPNPSTPSAPPSYSLTPSATDIAPPPYSPYPVSGGDLPYPTNSANAGNLPYPTIPFPDPSLANQGGFPYPINPSGPSTDIPKKE